MIKMLVDIKGKEFSFKKGKKYYSMTPTDIEELKGRILVRQSNSPKNQNWWTSFSLESEGTMYEFIRKEDMTFLEKKEEERILQL